MQSIIKDELIKIKNFFVSPRDIQDRYTIGKKWKSFLVVFGLNIVLIMIASGLISVLELFKLIDTNANIIDKYIRTINPGLIVIFMVIVGPIFEEIIFRAGLRYNKIIPLRIINYINMKQTGKTKEEVESKSRAVWNKYFSAIFYSSTIIFGLIHSFNYPINLFVILFLPIIVLPQFITGFLIAYMRVRYNFIYGLLLHIANNGLFICLAIIPMILSGYYNSPQYGKTYKIDNDKYYMKIVEIDYSPLKVSTIDLKYPETNFSNNTFSDEENFDKLTAKNASLTGLRETLAKVKNFKSKDPFELFSNKRYNIEYYSKILLPNNADTVIKYFELKTGERLKQYEQ